jgi:hypothetical protein
MGPVLERAALKLNRIAVPDSLFFRDSGPAVGSDRLEIALEQIPIRLHRLDCSKFLFCRVFRFSR